MPPCPVCAYSAATDAMLVAEVRTVECSGCGRFEIEEDLVQLLERNQLSVRQRANASGWLRASGVARLTVADLNRLRGLPTPSIPAKAERLMLYIAREFPDPGQHFGFSFDIVHRPLMSATTSQECEYIADYCTERMHWLAGVVSHGGVQGQISAVVTPEGWAYLASITDPGLQTPFGFIAMHFSSATQGLRERGIKPAIVAAGYDARLIDEVHSVNHVDDEILAAIQRSRFLIADLHGQRQNVYYEAGFAQGLGKKVIWTCSEADLVDNANHFDVRQFGFVQWSPSDLDDFRRQLTARIVSLLGVGPISR